MKKTFLILFFIYTQIFGQLVFTGFDKLSNVVKAYHLNLQTGQINELSFANSYLPRWIDETFIVLNIGNSIFKVDYLGESKKYFFDGFMPVVSRTGRLIAAYSKDGIIISDSSGKKITVAEVNYWSKITPTFSFDERYIFYYDKERDATYKFDISKQTNEIFAHHIFHPLPSPDGKKLLINVGKVDSNFRVGVVLSDWKETQFINYITSPFENSIVPIWSPSGRYIAYMTLLANKPIENSDLIPANIILYDTQTGTKTIIADDAGFTEGAFPQFSFSQDEKNFYYTKINDNGRGTIVELDFANPSNRKILIHDPNIDARIPLYANKPES